MDLWHLENRLKKNVDFMVIHAVCNARHNAGMTQADLAAVIGTKQSAISRIESGKVMPSIRMLDKIAEALGLRLNIDLYAPVQTVDTTTTVTTYVNLQGE